MLTVAELVIEVSDSTLAYDPGNRANLYAAAGIAEYWVIDVVHDRVHAFRDSPPDPGEPQGHTYFHLTILGRRDSITSLPAPTNFVNVTDLLP